MHDHRKEGLTSHVRRAQTSYTVTPTRIMSRLEDLQLTVAVRGILPDSLITVVSVQWFGSEALELTYKTPSGSVANEPVVSP